MKKIISLILSIAMLSITLTACGGTDSGDKNGVNLGQSGEQSQTGEPNDTLVIYDTTGLELNNGSRVSEFKSLYPDIKVEILACEDYTQRPDYDKKMMTKIMAGKGPDLIYIGNGFFDVNRDAEKMMRAGAFADMTSLIEDDKDFNYDNYDETAMKLGIFDGKRYVMPTKYNIPMLVTTQKLLDKTGFNIDNCTDYWKFNDEMKKYAATYKSGMPKLLRLGMFSLKDFNTMAGINTVDYDSQKTTLNSPEFKRGAEDIQKLTSTFTWLDKEGLGLSTTEHMVNQKFLFDVRSFGTFDGIFSDYYYLSEAGEEPVFSPIRDMNGKIQGTFDKGFAIMNSSQNKQNAYNFIKLMLDINEQTNGDNLIPLGATNSIPVLKEAVDIVYKSKYSSERIITYELSGSIKQENLLRKPLPKEVFDKYKGYLDEVANVSFNSGVQWELHEIMQEYYTGKVDYNTCIDKAKKTLDIYISE